MCHRYIQTSDLGSLHESLPFTGTVPLTPRHNIRPMQDVPVVYPRDGGNCLRMMQWGMDETSGGDTAATEINVPLGLAEDLAGPSLQQRCLIPADGFYECERRAGRRLQPWLVRLIEDGPFCFAGVWQIARALKGPTAYQCALLTVADNGTIAPLAARVPVILAKQDYATWLDPTTPRERLEGLLKPYRESGIYWHPVSAEILESERDIPSLAEPAQLIAA
ncbi:MAG TPA: SOS response-associated peptidase [Dongiaceae bacterium]|nr:SOS response-associated peptidase [Dongiaceae bacterium]